MLVDNLLKDIGFTESQQSQYYIYKDLIGNRLDDVAKGYMHGDITFAQALEAVHKLETDVLHRYTLDLMFVLECSSFLMEKYDREGVSRRIFLDSMKDLKYKLDECLNVEKIFGTKAIEWHGQFLDMRRFGLGRLQFNVLVFQHDDVTINGHTVKKGDFAVACHIPSSGPLRPEMCRESFEMAYEFFKDGVSGGVLPVTCGTWLLYPPYKEVFGVGSNTYDFFRNFNIIEVTQTENFADAWRVFGMDFDGDADKLPTNTTMQKNFVEYIKRGGSFGKGFGVVLLDGKSILTRQE